MDASGSLATGSARRYVAGDLLPESLPWDRFSSWLECVCVVTFDLELGQAIELVYPHDVRLSEREKTNICYLSFPDSYSGCLGDTQFSFRIRQSVGHKLLLPGEEDNYNQEAPVVLQRDPAHYYGYVYFRQVKDNTIKRGYFQKSLVLISQLPFVNLFHSLLNLVAPEYFEKLEPCLEAVCNEIDQWPSPAPGKVLSLPIMGVLIQVRIPSKNDKIGASPLKQSNQENLLPAPLVLPTVNQLDLFRCFQPILIHIQMLWELMLLGEPVIVMAPSPTVSSETILALISCIAPLRYFCDYRPYFTIHDSEFREYMTRTQAPPNVVLGVTNPFFIKTFQHWPHILRIGDVKMSGDLPKQIKVKKLTKLRTLDTKPGIYTSYKTFLHKDKALIKRLLKGIQRKRPEEAQNAILRRHVLELTQSFIIPLERYVASLMPLQRTITAWKNPPQIRPFNQEEFMKTLDYAGPQLTSVLKGDWVGLYRRFFKSPNFDGWFRLRHQEMARKLQTLHLEVLCETDLLLWVRDKSEVEIVDLVLKLREKLETARIQHLPVNQQLLHKLESYINTVISSLPEDLQAVLQQY
ncbi:protein DENND6B [Callorhinchus milii]|uniref:protein DENND6B n=1 Tax=Callorhinchus milii TaxID=7868 RepID=UPI0004571D54|nr:protein DENND6B [Callorhinchus milii]|eukprot:gi/632983745/ref/XP_007908800.1/ PREDICTED: protein DENND6B [Callorhinchus milii]